MVGFGLFVLRLAIAVVFLAHGGNKLFGLFGGPGIGAGGLSVTAAFFAQIGLHPPFLFALIDALEVGAHDGLRGHRPGIQPLREFGGAERVGAQGRKGARLAGLPAWLRAQPG